MLNLFKVNTYHLYEFINNKLVPVAAYKKRNIIDALLDHVFPFELEPNTMKIEKRTDDYIAYNFNYDGELRRFLLSDKEIK